MRKSKTKLIFTLAVALLSVLTMGVSTYAWFQANASVNIQTESDEATITVSAPDPIAVSNPAIYMYRGTPTGTSVTGTPYTLVSTEQLRTISDFVPGEQVTFAIKVTATSGTISSGSMNLGYQAYHLLNREIQGNSSKVVTILSAINLSTGTSTNGAYPASMIDKLTPVARGGIAKSSLTQVNATAKYRLTTPGSISNAVNNASFGASTAYFFFTITFVNTSSTFYAETNSSGTVINTTPTSDASTRYFSGSNSGSSTCYENLNFNITSAAITVA